MAQVSQAVGFAEPPKLTGNPTTDIASMSEWQWQFYEAAILSGGLLQTNRLATQFTQEFPELAAQGFGALAVLNEVDLATINDEAVNPGEWTPTLFSTLNIAAATPHQSRYIRIGNIVCCYGRADVDPTTTGQTRLGLSLPLPSNIGANDELSGVAAAIAVAGFSAGIYGDTANDRAIIEWVAVDTSARALDFTFAYKINAP
jgi:hypothetical protein